MDQKRMIRLIEDSFKERGTSLFRRLYHNQTQRREDAEQGDVSLCRHFAKLFNGDAALIEAAFKTSARFDRAVWDQNELFSGTTYGQKVIECAVGKIPERWKFLQGCNSRKPLTDADFRS